jgi:malate dehydrogenase
MSYPKVTIVGAGNVGATCALVLLEKNLCDVVLVDIAEGLPQGKALDLMHMRSVEKFGPRVTGTNDYSETADSDIVVITAGVPRKPGMSREDLVGVNSGIMKSVIEQAVAASPNAIFICVTNPLDIMVYLAYKESGLPKERLMGMGGVLDSARFAYSIAEKTGAAIDTIDALAMGAHGKAMVCMPRLSTVDGKPITEILSKEDVDEVCERTIGGGGEVVSLLKTGSAFYAPAASIAHMVKAILTDSGEVMSVCSYLDGQYGIKDVYTCVPTRLGRSGVQEIVELPFNEEELAALRASADKTIKSLDDLGLRK